MDQTTLWRSLRHTLKHFSVSSVHDPADLFSLIQSCDSLFYRINLATLGSSFNTIRIVRSSSVGPWFVRIGAIEWYRVRLLD